MVRTVTLEKIGGSLGVIIPKEMVSRQRLTVNDEVFAIETADGILLTAVDPTTRAALGAYAELAKENSAVMSALAKR